MARSPLLLAACLLACCAPLALAGDRILPTVTPACKDQFSTIIKEHYAGDAECSDMIRKAMNTAPKTAADCPGGKEAGAGSAVQKCMSKNEKAKAAWTTFVKGCEILNVNERMGAGEAEAAAAAKPSCFPRFNSLTAFKDFLEGKGAKSSAAASQAGGALMAAAAAAAYLLL